MAEFSYTTVPGRLKDLLAKLRSMGVPLKANSPWLASVGFRSGNDTSMIAVLKQIGFIDSSNVPTERWKQFRGANHDAILGEGIQQGYQSLFRVYPDAHRLSNEDLEHFFAANSTAGQQVLKKTVATFKVLCDIATFNGAHTPDADTADSGHSNGRSAAAGSQTQSDDRDQARSRTAGMATINVNVQLTLPETTDEAVYEKLFAAMKKHLMAGA